MVRLIAVAAAAMLVLTAHAAADPGGKARHGTPRSHGRDDGDGAGRVRPDAADVIITAVERALIQDYYYHERRGDDGATLPPGIRKNLARGKPLPPGIAKKMPDQLRGRLPVRDGYDYRVVGADVLLVELATGAIVDILRDVLR